MRHSLLLLLLLTFSVGLKAQEQQYKVAAIGFYNLENLFDTIKAPDINDIDFTPTGSYLWTSKLYHEKQGNLDRVISELGTGLSPDGLAILGVAEIENRTVLEDFVQQERVRKRNYQIVHYDSPDGRGIDVALLYQPKYYKVSSSRAVPLLIYGDDGERIKTRDILFVSGEFDGEPMHFLVNHWPSRRGGEAATQPLRNAGALVCKTICDSLMNDNPNAKVVIMGDLNDDPTSPSVRKVLGAEGNKSKVRQGGIYNPMESMYKKGMGTLAYRDAWSLFDQLLVTKGLVDDKAGGYQFYQVHVHNPSYLVQKTGHFKGYPYRTFSGSTYIGGFSDHFPVYMYLVKPVEEVKG